MANVVVAPVAVNRTYHCGPETREPYPRQIEGARRKVKRNPGVEVRGPSPDQPQHRSDDADPEENGDFPDRSNPSVQ